MIKTHLSYNYNRKTMNGSPASSTPTSTRGALRTESPDILRDSSLLQSDESVIAEQQHPQHSESEKKTNICD